MIKENKEVARNMVFAKLDDIYASITRQAGFVSFERKAHRMMEEGRTIDEISLVYLTDLRKQLAKKGYVVFYETMYVMQANIGIRYEDELIEKLYLFAKEKAKYEKFKHKKKS